ncbi:MAG: RlmE family RNA methyltransferase [Geminicoccaceae bacterium]|nr:RlmE family RNA methyltransferase [Geminicoccaceae bacterium]
MAERPLKVRVKSARGRRLSSTRWLDRQLNDPFVQRSKAEGYRSRAAYKLLEIDRKAKLLRKGARVLDLGSAPGGWAQVAARRGARVVGVDLQPVEPLPGVTLLQGDVFDDRMAVRMIEALGGPPDLILSDLAASATGQRAVDRLRAEAIGEAVLELARTHLAMNGGLVLKLVRGAENDVMAEAKKSFARTRLMRPEATRKDSSEIYLIAEGFRGAPDADPGSGDR